MKMLHIAVLLALFGLSTILSAIWPSLAASADPDAPKPVPGPFVDYQYGITAEMPDGLTYCPLGEDWYGSFHGYEAFLVPPSTCNPNRGQAYVAGSYETEPVPKITIFYGFDVAPLHLDPNDPDDMRPSDPEALVDEMCGKSPPPLPAGFMLLGAPAQGCRIEHADFVEVAMVAQFELSYAGPEARTLMALLYLRLFTTADRLARDLEKLKTVSASVRLCDSPDWDRPYPTPACPGWTWP